MKLINSVFLLLTCCMAYADELNLRVENRHETEMIEVYQKVYVTPEQIVVTENGFLVYTVEAAMPLLGRALAFDERGMYLEMSLKNWRGPCGLHQKWCRRCGGCGVLLCPMNCCCYD